MDHHCFTGFTMEVPMVLHFQNRTCLIKRAERMKSSDPYQILRFMVEAMKRLPYQNRKDQLVKVPLGLEVAGLLLVLQPEPLR